MNIRNLWNFHGFWISLIMGIGVLATLLVLTVNRDAIRHLLAIGPLSIVLVLALRGCSVACWGLRLAVLCRGLGYPLAVRRAIRLVLLGLLSNITAPGQAGGETFRIYELGRDRMATGTAAAVVVTERLLDVVVIGGIIFASALMVQPVRVVFTATFLGSLAALVILVGGLFVIVYYGVWHPETTKRSVKYIFGRFMDRCARSGRLKNICPSDRDRGSLMDAVDRDIGLFEEGIGKLSKDGRGFVAAALGMTALLWTFDFAVASLLLIALGQPPYVPESFLFQAIFQVIAQIPPMPEAVAVTIGAASLYALIIQTYLVGVFVLLWRLFEHYLNAPLEFIAGLFSVGEGD